MPGDCVNVQSFVKQSRIVQRNDCLAKFFLCFGDTCEVNCDHVGGDFVGCGHFVGSFVACFDINRYRANGGSRQPCFATFFEFFFGLVFGANYRSNAAGLVIA